MQIFLALSLQRLSFKMFSKMFYAFERLLSCLRLHLFNQKQEHFEILLQFQISVLYLNIVLNVIYFCDQS